MPNKALDVKLSFSLSSPVFARFQSSLRSLLSHELRANRRQSEEVNR